MTRVELPHSRLEDLKAGRIVEGIVPGEKVEVKTISHLNETTLQIIYKGVDSERLGETMVYRSQEGTFRVVSGHALWTFDGEGALLRVVSEAQRMRLAHLFDPFLAIHSSAVQPLPHQIEAVYGCMMRQQPLRFLLADDPGAGKTIMAGLFIKELLTRGDLDRCLIIAPGGLVDNWQLELQEKFDLSFQILDNAMLNTGNPFEQHPFLIAKMHHLAWRDDLLESLENAPEQDLIVVDEAHKMAASYTGTKVNRTLLNKLGQLASSKARHFLAMTATPHSGFDENFQLFLQLIDPDRFEGKPIAGERPDTGDIMRRRIKEDLITMSGANLFPPREADTLKFELSTAEQELYDAVSTYVMTEMNRAEKLLDPRKKNTVGFALTTLQRRLASSPRAIYESLRSRRTRLELRYADLASPGKADRPIDFELDLDQLDLKEIFEDADGLSTDQEDRMGDQAITNATASRTLPELEFEINRLTELEQMARDLVTLQTDTKWKELRGLLKSDTMKDADGTPRKIIIFTENAATLRYLRERVAEVLGGSDAVVHIDGSVQRQQRLTVRERFWHDPKIRVLVGTDAAGEGINLHCANIVINYDLPWNPNKLEQRFGRVHRIGQERTCYMFNLVATGTREGDVFERLLEKLERELGALDGKVFDVLGEAFEGKSLRDIFIEAIRNEEPVHEAVVLNDDLDRVVKEVKELMKKEATFHAPGLTDDERLEIREELERAEARKLQPYFVSSFFREAFARLGGQVEEREPGRYEIMYVPAEIRHHKSAGNKPLVLQRYKRITFEKDLVDGADYRDTALLLGPGHPLMDATVDRILKNHGDVLQQGAILVDEADTGTEPRLLVYVEDTIRDARRNATGEGRTASREFHFLEQKDGNGTWIPSGHAPYLDYQPLEQVVDASVVREIRGKLDTSWVPDDWHARILAYAQTELQPQHFERVRRLRGARVERIKKLVDERLSGQITHWKARMVDYQTKMHGNPKRWELPFRHSREKYDDLSSRRLRRITELDEEMSLQPQTPRVVGGALVLPGGFLKILAGATPKESHVTDTKTSERVAMDAVIRIETDLGFEVRDVSPLRGLGYDLESWGKSGHLRLVEVKARHPDAPAISFTVNEIRAGMNKTEDFILALVKVAAGRVQDVRYVRKPWRMNLDFHVTRVEISFDELWLRGDPPN